MGSWKALLIGGAALPLAGCMTAGTNMHGDFACRAPNGTCAPMSNIDAKAVASIGGGVRAVGDTTMPGIPNTGRVVTASTDGTPPARTSDRVLRVVFPAHIDAAGIYHDEATAHAVVERAVWTDGLTGGARAAQAVAAVVTAGPRHADTAADLPGSKLATMDEIIAARAAHGSPAAAANAASKPPVRSFKPVALRSAAPIDLREAAAAASAQPVAGLDPNYDTPDVRAVVADEAGQGAGLCVSYHNVRWHGRLHRKPYGHPCRPTVQSSAPMVAYALPAIAQGTLPSSAPSSAAAKPALPLVHFGETDNRAAAAAQLRTLTAPIMQTARPPVLSPLAPGVTPVDQLIASGAAPLTTSGNTRASVEPQP